MHAYLKIRNPNLLSYRRSNLIGPLASSHDQRFRSTRNSSPQGCLCSSEASPPIGGTEVSMKTTVVSPTKTPPPVPRPGVKRDFHELLYCIVVCHWRPFSLPFLPPSPPPYSGRMVSHVGKCSVLEGPLTQPSPMQTC
jgi:hypothetical protein